MILARGIFMSVQDNDPDFAPLGQRPLEVGRSSQAGLRLFHPTVSRRHATLTPSGDGIMVVDHDSRFGTFVNGVRVRQVSVQPGDRIQFGTMTAYRLQANGLKRDVASQGAAIAAAGVTISKGGRILVADAAFAIQPNAFVGVLGPSGAGKSTLLNCIASYQRVQEGRIVFDDKRDVNEDREEYRAILGHVPQDDVVYLSLTVQESLHFAARIQLGSETDPTELERAVEQALERVGLTEHADKRTFVLSGGQRKRLSVAVELLKRPRILLLDEPTSGLDPASEANLMEQLRYVAGRGTTVICTTHLMENVRLLDSLIVLGVKDGMGRIAYVGPPAGLLEHFGCRNFADLYEELSAGRFVPQTVAAEKSAVAGNGPEKVLAPALGAVVAPNVRPHASGGQRAAGPTLRELVARALTSSASQQALTVGSRALLNILRDRGLWQMMLAQPLILGSLVSLTQFAAAGIVPIYFFTVMISIWLGLNNAARDLVRDRKHYVRERLSGLRPAAYLGAKAAVYALVGTVQLLLLLCCICLAGQLILSRNTAADLHKASSIWLFTVTLLCYGCGLGMGLLTSVVARTEEAAVAALPLLIMPQLLLSALAVGQILLPYSKPRAFKPLLVMLTDKQSISAPAKAVDFLSLFCYSRPGTLLLEAPRVAEYGNWIWLGDLCHLCILLVGTWVLMFLAFKWAEETWPRLIGLG